VPRSRKHADALSQAKARERAAGKKVSRNEAMGTQLAHSHHDPRLGAKALEQLTTRQLQEHTRRVNEFVSRQTQFVHNYSGAPIKKDRWREYQRLEAINNARGDSVLDKFGGDELPGQEGTIAGRLDRRNLRNTRRNNEKQRERANNQGRVFEPIERDVRYVESEAGLEKLISQMRKRTNADYLSKTTKARLNSGRAILKYSGNADLIDMLDNLTLEQRMLLADVSEFFDIALENFNSPDKSEVDELMDADYNEHQGIAATNTHVREAMMQELNWVKKVAPRGGKKRDDNGNPIAYRNPRDKQGNIVDPGTERAAEPGRNSGRGSKK
jgi:hypothetical protein